MNRLALPALALFSLYFLSSCHPHQKSDADEQGSVFITNAKTASRAEIKAAQAALTTTKNPRVVNFAKMLIQDYNSDLEKLKDVKAAAKGSDSSAIIRFYSRQMKKTSGLSGAEFDKAYINSEMVSTGRLLMFYVDATQGKKDSTNTYSHQIAPVVQAHLDSAKNILSSLK